MPAAVLLYFDLLWTPEIERIRADGPGILLVEQNVVQSLAIAARAYMLENGSVVLEGPAPTLRDDPQLKKAYLGL